MRIIALDVHRSFAQTAILESGKLRDAGKIDLEYSRLLRFARKLKPDDEIVIEATGNTSAIVRVRRRGKSSGNIGAASGVKYGPRST